MSPSPVRLRHVALGITLLLSGCALDPVDTKPVPLVAETVPAASPGVASRWWLAFGDPALDSLVERALKGSPDVASALAHVRDARAAAGYSDSGFWPTFGVGGSYSRQHYSESNLSPALAGHTTGNYGVGGALSYEVDLWGRVRNSAAAAEADFRSAEADLAGARLLVAAEVVRLWFDLGFAKAETALLARECAVRERALALLTTREKNGLVSEAEPLRAGLATETAKAELEQATLRVGLLRNALVAAIGATPGEPGVTEPGELATVPVPVIREQVPASLLRTRPDIAAADLRLDAVLAREGAARANFYPNITLSASGGFSSINAGDLFNSSSRVWSFGPTLSLPILTGGKNDAALESARAHFDDAWAAYRRSVLTAFRETEDALLSLDKLRVRERRLADADHAAGRSLAIAHTRRDKGLSSEVEVTLAERDALHANRERLRAHHDVLVASAGLARALGGGWDRAVSPEQQPVAVEP